MCLKDCHYLLITICAYSSPMEARPSPSCWLHLEPRRGVHHMYWTKVCGKWTFGGNYVPRQSIIQNKSKHSLWSADHSTDVLGDWSQTSYLALLCFNFPHFKREVKIYLWGAGKTPIPQHEDLSFDPQQPHTKPSVVVYVIPDLGHKGRRIPEACWPASPDDWVSFRFSKRPYF